MESRKMPRTEYLLKLLDMAENTYIGIEASDKKRTATKTEHGEDIRNLRADVVGLIDHHKKQFENLAGSESACDKIIAGKIIDNIAAHLYQEATKTGVMDKVGGMFKRNIDTEDALANKIDKYVNKIIEQPDKHHYGRLLIAVLHHYNSVYDRYNYQENSEKITIGDRTVDPKRCLRKLEGKNAERYSDLYYLQEAEKPKAQEEQQQPKGRPWMPNL